MDALRDNTTGNNNTAIGADALLDNTTGALNTALGAGAGVNLVTGNNNIDIANDGVAGESGTIRIGNPIVHGATYIAGKPVTFLYKKELDSLGIPHLVSSPRK